MQAWDHEVHFVALKKGHISWSTSSDTLCESMFPVCKQCLDVKSFRQRMKKPIRRIVGRNTPSWQRNKRDLKRDRF